MHCSIGLRIEPQITVGLAVEEARRRARGTIIDEEIPMANVGERIERDSRGARELGRPQLKIGSIGPETIFQVHCCVGVLVARFKPSIDLSKTSREAVCRGATAESMLDVVVCQMRPHLWGQSPTISRSYLMHISLLCVIALAVPGNTSREAPCGTQWHQRHPRARTE
jgi:hypothetical protein